MLTLHAGHHGGWPFPQGFGGSLRIALLSELKGRERGSESVRRREFLSKSDGRGRRLEAWETVPAGKGGGAQCGFQHGCQEPVESRGQAQPRLQGTVLSAPFSSWCSRAWVLPSPSPLSRGLLCSVCLVQVASVIACKPTRIIRDDLISREPLSHI